MEVNRQSTVAWLHGRVRDDETDGEGRFQSYPARCRGFLQEGFKRERTVIADSPSSRQTIGVGSHLVTSLLIV